MRKNELIHKDLLLLLIVLFIDKYFIEKIILESFIDLMDN